jgi:dihydrofolate reductase
MSGRKIVEYTLVSLDGVFEDPARRGFMQYRDDAYLRDGLGLLLTCDAMLMGRSTYVSNAQTWPGRQGQHPWADRLNTMCKYVFSNTLECADWNNSVLVRGDAIDEISRLKQGDGANLLVWGHGRLTRTLLEHQLLDVIDISIHPLISGSGGLWFREGQTANLQLVATRTFAKGIVKLTYEPDYSRPGGI